MFPVQFLSFAVHGGLVLVAGSALALAALWVRDFYTRRLW